MPLGKKNSQTDKQEALDLQAGFHIHLDDVYQRQ